MGKNGIKGVRKRVVASILSLMMAVPVVPVVADAADTIVHVHNYVVDEENSTLPSFGVQGRTVYVCTGCGDSYVEYSTAETDLTKCVLTLSRYCYEYDGYNKKPQVSVTYDGQEVDPSLYTVTYKDNRAIGTATVIVTGSTPYAVGTLEAEFEIEHTSHDWVTDSVYSTPSSAGYLTVYCSSCGKIKSKAKVPMVVSMELSRYVYPYDGTSKFPSITIKDAEGKVLTSYSAEYGADTYSIGSHTVTATLYGSYSGKMDETFVINPNRTKIKKLKAGRKSFTVKWAKRKGGVKYQVQYSTKKSFPAKKTKTKTVGKLKKSKTIKGLKSGKTYYVRVRTCKTVDGVTYYSKWSAKKKVKVR